MRLFAVQSAAALLFMASRAYALPNPAPTYSVIDVDGGRNGQASGAAPIPVTVYRTIVESALSPIRVSTTVTELETKTALVGPSATTITEHETTTVFAEPSITTVTVAQTEAYTVTIYTNTISATSDLVPASSTSSLSVANEFTISSTSDVMSTSTTTYSLIWTMATPTSIIETSEVAVSTEPASSTAYYDDGLWHTSYPVKPTSVQPLSFSTTYFQLTYTQSISSSTSSSTSASASESLSQRRARPVRRSI